MVLVVKIMQYKKRLFYFDKNVISLIRFLITVNIQIYLGINVKMIIISSNGFLSSIVIKANVFVGRKLVIYQRINRFKYKA